MKQKWPWKWRPEDTGFLPSNPAVFKDITGKRGGKLVALYPTHRDHRGFVRWDFQCDCGEVLNYVGTRVMNGDKKSCGCGRHVQDWPWKWSPADTDFLPSHGSFNDITGKRGGKLVALYPTHSGFRGIIHWVFQCDCGGRLNYAGTKVMNGYKTCCGCTRAGAGHFGWTGHEAIPGKFLKGIISGAKLRGHIFGITPQYLWSLFVAQSGKCALSGLSLTFKDSRKRTEQTASLDRIDSDLGYIEGNVQWVHRDINLMKNVLSQERFIRLCCLVDEKFKYCPDL